MTAEELWRVYSEDKNLEDVEYEAWQFGVEPDKLAESNRTFSEDMNVVFEEFELVYT